MRQRCKQILNIKKHGCGLYCNYPDTVLIVGGDNITIGRRCFVGPHVYLLGTGGIKIANHVSISAYVKILTTGIDIEAWTSQLGYKNRVHICKPVFINNYAWVGVGAIICPGVQIKGVAVIVGAGAVVTKDVEEDFVLVAGNPAEVVKRYKDDKGAINENDFEE